MLDGDGNIGRYTCQPIIDHIDRLQVSSDEASWIKLHLKFIDGADLGEVSLRVRPQGGRAVIIIDGSYRFRWSLFWIFDRANCLDLTFSVLSFFREALGRAVNIILIFVA